MLADPYRVVIETTGLAVGAAAVMRRPVGAIAALHSDETAPGRLVVELRHPALVKQAFIISPRDGLGWRFVLDLEDSTRPVFLAAAGKPPPARESGGPPSPRSSPRSEVIVGPPPASQAPVSVVPPPQVAAAPPPVGADPQSGGSASIFVVSPQAADPPPSAPAVPVAADPSPPPRPEDRVADSGGSILSAVIPPPPPVAERPVPPPAPATEAAVPVPVPVPLTERHRGDGKPVIVIDPGHGGVDPGAIGVSGMYEKYITIAVAQELKRQLERSGRYHVHLTHDRDVFISLRDRVGLARQYNADLFISLHADSEKDSSIRGLSVYTLSQNASDAEAQALADKENKADLIAGIDLSHESADVANILIDLAQRETLNRSAAFAAGIVDELGQEISLLANTHRFAGFAVLKAPDVPAVLIEMGYLSNQDEEKKLSTPQYRTKLARAITRAVDGFFARDQRAHR